MQEHPIWRSWWKLEAAKTSTLRDPLPRNAIQSAHIFFKYRYILYAKNMIDLSLNLNAGNIHHLGMMKVPEWKPSIILGRPVPPFFSRPMADELETSEKSLEPRSSSLKPREKSSRAKSEETKAGASKRLVLLKRPFRWGIENDIWCIVKLPKWYVCSGGPATKQKQPYVEQVSLDRYCLLWGNGKWVLKPFGFGLGDFSSVRVEPLRHVENSDTSETCRVYIQIYNSYSI